MLTQITQTQKPLSVEGHCSGVSAGAHEISLHVDQCPNGYAKGDAFTGWHTQQRFIIEEIRLGSKSLDGIVYLKAMEFSTLAESG